LGDEGALLAVNNTLSRQGVAEVKTVSSSRLVLLCELGARYAVSYFDSLLVASVVT